MNRSEIWLGDLLRVFKELQPRGEEEATVIGRMLKLDRVAAASDVFHLKGAFGPSASPRHADVIPPRVRVSEQKGSNTFKVPEPRPSRADTSETRLTLVSIGTREMGPPAWVSSTTPLPPPVKSHQAPPAPPALIKKHVRRAILSAALATHVPEGPLDLKRIFNELVNCRPLADMPRLPLTTLRQGVQVLVDGWIGMAPFSADQEGMVRAISRMIPPDRFELLYFTGCPTRGVGTGSPKDWYRWQAPPRHTRILVMSDLGIGGPLLDGDRSNAREWLIFAKQVQDACCPIAALVPYEPARWPTELANSITLIHWSERLTAGAIRRAIGRGFLRR
jgi:hypothetical protein